MFNVENFEISRRGSFGSPFHYFPKLDSTNRLGEELARQGASEGTVVLTDEQMSGIGRKGNAWFSPPGENLYFTLILRPDESRLHYIPFIAGIALVRLLAGYRIPADLKWPNDIIVQDKKICGILIQTAVEQNRLRFAVLGCGLNVNTASFPAELGETATSIRSIKGEVLEREPVLAQLLLEFQTLYETISDMPWQELCREVESVSSFVRNCEVVIREQERDFRGITEGLDPFGGLIVRAPEGEARIFYAGDIQSCRKK